MSCLESAEAAELRRQSIIRSRHIDLQLKEERKHFPHTHSFLVMGTHDSEKSTFVKQIKIHSSGYSTQERYKEVRNVRATIRHIIQAAIDILGDPSLCHQSVIPMLQYMKDNIIHLPMNHSDFPREFYEYCNALWQDEGIQQCLLGGHHQHDLLLSDCAEYFMLSSKLLEVSQQDYTPSDKDILKAKEWNPGFTMTNTTFHRINFEFLEVNHEFSMKRKWAQRIRAELLGVLFVVDISNYNIISENHTDKTENKVAESLAYFREMCADKQLLYRVPIVLLLNGMNKLKRKIVDEDIPLVDYFPSFQHYRAPPLPPQRTVSDQSNTEYIVQEPDPLRNAKCFFQETFLRDVANNYSHCHVLFTSTDDSENTSKLFNVARDIVMRIQLEKYEIL